MIALGREGSHQVLAARKHHQQGRRAPVDRHHGTQGDPQGIGTFNHAVVTIEQHHVGAPVRIAVRLEDARHFLFEVEAQTQHADDDAGVGMQHAAGIDQRLLAGGAQVRGAKRFDVAVAGQRLRNQRINAAFERRGFINLHQHVACGIEQNDFVIHRVFAAVGTQSLANGARVVGEAGDKGAQFVIGGEKAHIGGALVQIAHHNVDDVLGLGPNLVKHRGHFLTHQTGHQFLLQTIEAFTRGRHGRQNGLGLDRAVHLGRRFNHAPHQVQLVQRLFAANHVAHVGQVSINLKRGSRVRHVFLPIRW